MSIILKNPVWGPFLRKGAFIILKNVKVEFEFALRVGDINVCRFKTTTVGSYFFFFTFSRKLVLYGTI